MKKKTFPTAVSKKARRALINIQYKFVKDKLSFIGLFDPDIRLCLKNSFENLFRLSRIRIEADANVLWRR